MAALVQDGFVYLLQLFDGSDCRVIPLSVGISDVVERVAAGHQPLAPKGNRRIQLTGSVPTNSIGISWKSMTF